MDMTALRQPLNLEGPEVLEVFAILRAVLRAALELDMVAMVAVLEPHMEKVAHRARMDLEEVVALRGRFTQRTVQMVVLQKMQAAQQKAAQAA